MSHPDTTNYPILRTTSNADGTPIQAILDLIPGKPFGLQTSISQDDLCICIDDHLGLSNWGGYVVIEPRMNEFKFTGVDRPSYVPPASHVTSYANALTIVNTRGPVGVAWAAPEVI